LSKQVRVEIGPNGLPCRIFRDHYWKTCENEVQIMDRGKAVGAIRAQVFDRATGDSPAGGETSECERCGRYIRWDTFEMHETLPKGKGGEVALSNCEALCHQCHQGGPDSAHGNRRWQTSKSGPKGPND
jgi:hypothetical protein